NPPRGAEARGAHWVKPTVVAEIAFTEFTSDGSLRHPSFQGLREDKPARQVVREEPAATTPPAMASAPSRNGKPPVARQTRGSDLRSRAAKREDATVAGVSLSNPEKVLYPEQGLTKRDLAEYYAAVADRMLPYVRNRPLMLVR